MGLHPKSCQILDGTSPACPHRNSNIAPECFPDAPGGSRRLPRRSRRLPEASQTLLAAPRSFPDAPGDFPEGSRRLPRRCQMFPRRSRRLPEASQTLPETQASILRLSLGAILEFSFGLILGCILDLKMDSPGRGVGAPELDFVFFSGASRTSIMKGFLIAEEI